MACGRAPADADAPGASWCFPRRAAASRKDAEATTVVTTFATNLAAELSRSLERLHPDLRFADQLGATGADVGGR